MVEDEYQKELIAFGKQLKKIRGSKGLRQLDVEIATNINRTDVSKIEHGLKNIELRTIVKLSVALNVTLSEFFPPPSPDDE